jgi:uncharacterized repeat protein (TIGR03803 family)
VIYTFKGGQDGGEPQASLVALNGLLYGSTYLGGKRYGGTVFSITTSGTKRVIHNFDPYSSPSGELLARNGTLYGTTGHGIFTMTPTGKTTILHTFRKEGDGASPNGDLIAVEGQLYGTTEGGGLNLCGGNGCGTVFRLSF